MEEGVAAGLARGVSRTAVNPPGSTGADKAFRGDQLWSEVTTVRWSPALQLVLAGLGRQCDLRQSEGWLPAGSSPSGWGVPCMPGGASGPQSIPASATVPVVTF